MARRSILPRHRALAAFHDKPAHDRHFGPRAFSKQRRKAGIAENNVDRVERLLPLLFFPAGTGAAEITPRRGIPIDLRQTWKHLQQAMHGEATLDREGWFFRGIQHR